MCFWDWKNDCLLIGVSLAMGMILGYCFLGMISEYCLINMIVD